MKYKDNLRPDHTKSETNRISNELEALKRRLKELETAKSFKGLKDLETTERDLEIQRVQAQINFLIKGRRELKAHLENLKTQGNNVKESYYIN